MSGSDAKTGRSDARRNRERILVAARAAFAADGAALEMRRIAEDAGVGVGTLFRNFPAKQDLVDAMMAEWAVERDAALAHSLSIVDPWAAVVDHVLRCGEVMSREPGLRRFLTDAPVKGQVSQADTKFSASLGELVGRAQIAGVLRTGVTAATYYGLLVGLSAAITAGSPWRVAADVIVAGLRPDQALSVNGPRSQRHS
ncbi:TetR/AcrR family transcriptional regulator [Nocardia arthritidis]|uniref:TetR family transcriptional regulator n=1 Tax=Nocardia arthritidis TaxID=228602 RepID=A0A6G9YKS0_9NOCA|nr:TetR/AcrR family transcriptional regulator [Nocardia arthritidis]QIS13667.1 TetR family transcriptional regulator [Nocardia arthritidis]